MIDDHLAAVCVRSEFSSSAIAAYSLHWPSSLDSGVTSVGSGPSQLARLSFLIGRPHLAIASRYCLRGTTNGAASIRSEAVALVFKARGVLSEVAVPWCRACWKGRTLKRHSTSVMSYVQPSLSAMFFVDAMGNPHAIMYSVGSAN